MKYKALALLVATLGLAWMLGLWGCIDVNLPAIPGMAKAVWNVQCGIGHCSITMEAIDVNCCCEKWEAEDEQ